MFVLVIATVHAGLSRIGDDWLGVGCNTTLVYSINNKRKVVQNVNRMSENNISVCQYVRLQLFSLVIKRKVIQNVKTMSENIMSVCQHVRMQLFSLAIKMKVVQNVINKDVRQSV